MIAALVLAAVLACGVPMLWPDVTPLVDLPGHMGRYHVQMEIGRLRSTWRTSSAEKAITPKVPQPKA